MHVLSNARRRAVLCLIMLMLACLPAMALAGYASREVELSDENEAYERPPFLGREVTGDRRFYNSCLRIHPFKEWKEELSSET